MFIGGQYKWRSAGVNRTMSRSKRIENSFMRTNKCIHRYEDLLYYNQSSLLHVSASYCVAIFSEVFLKDMLHRTLK